MATQPRVVTLTLNPAVDQTVEIPGFSAGAVNRVRASRLDAGGKGINVAAFLADFGIPVAAAGFLGAENASIFTSFFASKGIADHCIRIPGATRVGVKIVDPLNGQTTDLNFPGLAPQADEIGRLLATLDELAAACDWFVLAGSLPQGVSPAVYRQVIERLAGKKVILDSSGEALRQGVCAHPWLIKPNTFELQELVGQPVDTLAAILSAARGLMATHSIASVVVSMGAEGAVFVDETEAVWAVPPQVEVRSTVGAGDALVAGITAARLGGLSLAESARLATAFAACAVCRIGAGLPAAEVVRAAAERVELRRVQ